MDKNPYSPPKIITRGKYKHMSLKVLEKFVNARRKAGLSSPENYYKDYWERLLYVKQHLDTSYKDGSVKWYSRKYDKPHDEP
jgi:hypothetical protein